MRSVLQMSGTEMLLAECILFAVRTLGSLTGITMRPAFGVTLAPIEVCG